ncbi:MAG: hypothetical protein EB015_22175, partial [Methylocystaceae bacterium]|nr:hypothetical protein [Methylocystaceae bacterium]
MSAAVAPTTTRQPSSCQVCFQPGHCYRNCSHPSIEASHLQGVELYRQFTMSHHDAIRQANMDTWIMNLSRGMMRVLLARHAPAVLLYEFESIQAWRVSRDERWRAWRDEGQLSHQIYIPARPSIQGVANMEELRDMIHNVYSKLADEIIVADIDSMEIIAANDHVAQMRRAFIQLSRNLRNANLTGEGVQNYAQDAIDYLQVIIQQQEARAVFPPVPVPVMREEYLDTPLLRMAHIPMPRPTRVVEENPDFMPLRARGGTIPRQNQRQPTFIIDLRLLAPPAAASADAGAVAMDQDPVQCGICWDELNDESRIITNCNHNYCNGCITSQIDSIRAKYRRSGD